MKGIKVSPYLVATELDEREDISLSVSYLDKHGNAMSNISFNVKQAEDVAYALLRLIYKIKNNAKLPDVKPEE